MKKVLIYLIIWLFIPLFSHAQTVVRDDFETNKLGWNEVVSKQYSAIIQDGKMHLETKEGGAAIARCFAPIDPQKPFEIKAKLNDTKINDEERGIGIIFNYRDNKNFDAFVISKNTAEFQEYTNGQLTGFCQQDIKYFKKYKDHELVIKYSFQKVVFYVNDINALEMRDIKLQYTGFGLYVWSKDDKQIADFDWIEFKQ